MTSIQRRGCLDALIPRADLQEGQNAVEESVQLQDMDKVSPGIKEDRNMRVRRKARQRMTLCEHDAELLCGLFYN